MQSPLSLQPIPYQGSKRALAPRICSLFPERIGTLYEPFAGSSAVTLYAATHGLAERFVIGDAYAPLIELWRAIIEKPSQLSDQYESLWHKQFEQGLDHFNQVRSEFNETKSPVMLLYLVARCVKNAVRFNRHGNFSQSVDKRRTGMKPDRVTRTVHAVSRLLRGRTALYFGDFQQCAAEAGLNDLVYMDPPYQGTTYGRDKRYALGLNRETLVDALHEFDHRRVPYILSYDGQSGERVYGDPLPSTIKAKHFAIHAGRSAQATLVGRSDTTIESLYVSRTIQVEGMDVSRPKAAQGLLFAT